ncbi:hypothetical protein GPALN_011248 [Globodera pallida]|nr:hypothetical protein GPALN_011248 [Globodera pallida]
MRLTRIALLTSAHKTREWVKWSGDIKQTTQNNHLSFISILTQWTLYMPPLKMVTKMEDKKGEREGRTEGRAGGKRTGDNRRRRPTRKERREHCAVNGENMPCQNM